MCFAVHIEDHVLRVVVTETGFKTKKQALEDAFGKSELAYKIAMEDRRAAQARMNDHHWECLRIARELQSCQ